MRPAWILVLVACSTNGRTTTTERTKDDARPVARVVPDSTESDAMTGPTADEIEQALHGLGSEHGASDVRNIEWWRTNAAQVRPHLRAMLEDGKDDMQSDRWAIRILGDIGDPADVALLASVLSWKADTARMEAAAALGAHPAPAAGAALIEATKGADVDTASYAVDGLGARKADPAAKARVEELLDHPTSTMRFHAVNALAELGGGKAALEKRQKTEKDAEVRAAIAKALKK